MKNLSRLIPLACLLSAPALAADADSQFLVGGGIAGGSRYAGSGHNMVAPVVVLDYTHSSGFFASSLRGLGYGAQIGPFNYSAALGYRGERREENEKSLFGNNGSEELKGMGDIKGNASALLSLGYKPLSMLEFNVRADVPLSQRDNGKTVHGGVSAQLMASDTDALSVGVSAGFADAKYAQTYHGVNARQAARSRFKAYTPKSGLYEANLMLTWQHRLASQWSMTTMLGANHLLGDAADSPLTKRKTSPAAAVYVTYAY
ncbi:MipA/OmpV family protein [Duganella sp. P38]|uniref:MipA/OmpV family protein n=1 Tax=Duganella sp. P38 TaxID=3423949 RepID=UPI003D791EED